MKTTDTKNAFLDHIQRRLSKNTCVQYRQILNKFSKAMPEQLENITPEHIGRWLDGLPVSAKTVNCYLFCLRSFFCFCNDLWNIESPVKYRKLRTLPPKQRIITDDEFDKIIKACNSNVRKIITFLAMTGLRSSELLSLTKDSFQGDMLIVQGKGNKVRYIPLNDTAITAATPLLDFLSLLKSYRTRRAIYHLCQKTSKRAGVPRVNPHSYRHYLATSLIRKNVSMKIVSEILGHHSASFTEKQYCHLVPQIDLQGSTDCLDKK